MLVDEEDGGWGGFLSYLWGEVEFAGDVFVAFDDEETAVGVADDNITLGDLAFAFGGLGEFEGPFVADAYDRGEAG